MCRKAIGIVLIISCEDGINILETHEIHISVCSIRISIKGIQSIPVNKRFGYFCLVQFNSRNPINILNKNMNEHFRIFDSAQGVPTLTHLPNQHLENINEKLNIFQFKESLPPPPRHLLGLYLPLLTLTPLTYSAYTCPTHPSSSPPNPLLAYT